jgi:type VI secretion system secreted protein VgrG
MAKSFLEENRYLYIKSSLGANELLLHSFTGTEAVSELFSFQLELLSENPRIRFEDILGQPVTFGILGPEGSDPRHINGIVTAFTQLPKTERFSTYRAVVSPKVWTLKRNQYSRIFQNLSVGDILTKVFQGSGITDFKLELQGQHDPRIYCVQYRETDFNFISRLMEEEGIFYFFKHTMNAHKMVIADSPVSHPDLPEYDSLSFDEIKGGLRDEAAIHGWAKTQELRSGKYSLRDYSYDRPKLDLSVEQTILDAVQVGKVTHYLRVAGNDQFEIYDYPGGYGIREQGGGAKSAGEPIAKHGVEHLEMSQFLIRGESNAFNLTPGYKFNFRRHEDSDGSYILTRVTHSAREGGFVSGEKFGDDHYSNMFECIPNSLHYRPGQKAVKPRVHGCQTAVVVGPAGEEIYTDDKGRIKVQFHWDREGKNDGSSSCWVRVATLWADKNWGMIHVPRIGQEVIVDFLEGDPDCPIIIGSVYNGDNMPPYSLPGDKTQSGIKTRSSKGGATGNFNEIRFEDLKGSEEIHVQAEKDMTVRVKHDRTTNIDNDEILKILRDRTTTVDRDDMSSIGKHMHLDAGSEIVLKTGSSKIVMKSSGTIEISGVDVTIKGSAQITSEAGATHTIKGGLVKIN